MSEIVSWPQVDGRGLAPRPGFPVLPQVGREGRAATLQPHWSACTRSGRGRAGEEPASDTWPRPWPGHAPPSRSARGVKPAENTWLLTSPRMRAKAENSPNALDLTLRFGKDNGQWESKKKKKNRIFMASEMEVLRPREQGPCVPARPFILQPNPWPPQR